MTVLVLITLLALGSLALTAQPATAQEQQENATLPISYPPTVLEGDSESCASIEEREMARTQICEDIRGSLRDVVIPTLDIVTPCGGPGWTLAASLDMTDPTQNCPSAEDERTESGKRLCFQQPSGSPGCDSVTFPTDGKQYTHVCGRAIGYQYAYPDAFGHDEPPGTYMYNWNHYVRRWPECDTRAAGGSNTHLDICCWAWWNEWWYKFCPCDNPANNAWMVHM